MDERGAHRAGRTSGRTRPALGGLNARWWTFIRRVFPARYGADITAEYAQLLHEIRHLDTETLTRSKAAVEELAVAQAFIRALGRDIYDDYELYALTERRARAVADRDAER